MKVLVTGGAGFIGSAVIRKMIRKTDFDVLNFDKLTYAGNLESLNLIEAAVRYDFLRGDICDAYALKAVFSRFQPDIVMNLAAESHVDRSIESPSDFVQTNIVGTYTLLEACRVHWEKLAGAKKELFKLIHVSTDEVFGDLAGSNALFQETSAYNPSSPYSASKASSDHLVRAWQRTYGLPAVITNCSNNYGPYQFPEKLIPHMILNAITGRPLPIYGTGEQIRDWLYVEDHATALITIALNAQSGQTYNIGGHNEIPNIVVVKKLCALLENLELQKPSGLGKYTDLITYVEDRPGHDKRYAIDAGKIENELGWKPKETFETGLKKTVDWYLKNQNWWRRVMDGDYSLDRIGHGKVK